MTLRMFAYASGVAGAGNVLHTLAEREGYLPDAISIRAYLCDVELNDVLCDNRRDCHVPGANKRQIVLEEPYMLANGTSFPLLLIFFV
jgi:hypothetical protein